MTLDETHPLNQLVLRYLGRDGKRSAGLLALPGSVKDAYYGQGSHPDVVSRVWDHLGNVLPNDSRCLVYGTPALVHPHAGVILAICNGTEYNLRLAPDGLEEAAATVARTATRWSGGQEMDAVQVLGTDWIFGSWSADEARWCRAAYDMIDGH